MTAKGGALVSYGPDHHEAEIPARRPGGIAGLRARHLPTRRRAKITVAQVVALMVVMQLLFALRAGVGGSDAVWVGAFVVSVLGVQLGLGYRPATEAWRLVVHDAYFEVHERIGEDEVRQIDGRLADLGIEALGSRLVIRCDGREVALDTALPAGACSALCEALQGLRGGRPAAVQRPVGVHEA